MTVAGLCRGLVRHRRFAGGRRGAEVVEETGLVCRAVQLLALFDKLKASPSPQLPHAHKAFFLCEVTGGALLTDTDETKGAGTSPSTPCPNSPATGWWRPSCAPCMTICRRGGGYPVRLTGSQPDTAARRQHDHTHRQYPHPEETQGELPLRRRGAGADPAGWRGGSAPLRLLLLSAARGHRRLGAALRHPHPAGEAALRCYQFNTRTAKHYFCSVCGIYTHHQRRSNPAEYGYNLACLEGSTRSIWERCRPATGCITRQIP